MATYCVTFRLAGSLPAETIERLKRERVHALRRIGAIKQSQRRVQEYRYYQASSFERFDELLDASVVGPQWLRDGLIATAVADAVRLFLAHPNELLCYCIMPNHVHLICKPYDSEDRASSSTNTERPEGHPPDFRLTQILSRVKGATARQANLILHRRGAFWQHESYDRVIRDAAELERTVWYVLNNPVKARLVDEWEEWPWTYCNPNLLHMER